MPSYKLILFDFDGTLMDTSEGIYESARYALSKAGIKIDKKVNLQDFIGPPISYGFRKVFNVNDERIVNYLMDEYRKDYSRNGSFKAVFYDGFPDILKTLKDEGFILAVASMKNTDLIKEMLVHFKMNFYFSGVFGLNVQGTNTKADVIKEALIYFDVKPEEAVMVGDSVYDYDGACEAGVDCIKVNWGFGYTNADFGTVSSISELFDEVHRGVK